jgi:triosephosphate isomerase
MQPLIAGNWKMHGTAPIRILYGGSLNPTNARAVFAVPEVGGALIGGASLKAAVFEAIVGAVPAHA